MKYINIQGARTHNLNNINVTIPRDQLVVMTGLSGSGKSSLAFDTLYAEGQRRYVESLSAYARQFLSMMEKPDIDQITGLSPAISIEQKSTSHNPRSTVGTVTEIYDYLRLLFARAGDPVCPEHQKRLAMQTISQMADQLLALPDNTKIMLLAPVINNRKGEHVKLLQELQAQGFIRARINGEIYELDNAPKLDLYKKHTIEVVVDRLKTRPGVQQRLAESLETAVRLGDGFAMALTLDEPQQTLSFSAKFACPDCGYSLSELEPRLFSFNNPNGACPDCDGLGVKQYFDPKKLIVNESLSLAGGAIAGWNSRHYYHYQLLQCLADYYQFDLHKPFQQLPESIQETVLYGTGDNTIPIKIHISSKKTIDKNQPFEGVIPSMQRRYQETESEAVYEELCQYLSQQSCTTCHGSRLNEQARHVLVDQYTLPEITDWPIDDTYHFFQHLQLPGHKGQVAERILKEINQRLHFLIEVGLGYLTINRSAETLSGGEAQRIRLASQIGSGLVGVMYILDEPSIGLHQRDNARLLRTLMHLRDLGNTVIVVEHDEEAIRQSDHIIDMGPGPGDHGGEVVASGPLSTIINNQDSLTADYLSGRKTIPIPSRTHPRANQWLYLNGTTANNLQSANLELPLGLFTCVTGVSGSGKSSLINHTLYPLAATRLNRATQLSIGDYDNVQGLDQLDKVVDINQSPIGRTPRSNPATYTGLFTIIRELFAGTPEARSRGYKPGRFSFNVKGGRCEACQGDGVIKVEMHFLADIYVECEVCNGLRYNRETLDIQYKGKNIHEVLNLTVEQALEFFSAVPSLTRRLQTLMDVGLPYIRLGQNATTLSGGEAQRVKLSRELAKRSTGKTLYILDEPSTGLHFHDIAQLLKVLQKLRDEGNTVVVIEHNLDIIKVADWLIDLGPEGGKAGGKIVATGTPEEVTEVESSHTGHFLKPMLQRQTTNQPV